LDTCIARSLGKYASPLSRNTNGATHILASSRKVLKKMKRTVFQNIFRYYRAGEVFGQHV
jgi:hypothetical protein